MLGRQSWIDQANENINISDVLESLGVYIPSTIRDGSNKKIHCPFGFYHSDGGTAKAMKIFVQSNSAYCFSCGKRYSPVTLAAASWDCSWQAAALQLLEQAGIKAKTIEQRWVEATTPETKNPDLIALADALKMYCAGTSEDWTSAQYDATIAGTLTKCLTLLSLVKTDEDAHKWLDACKKVMYTVLNKGSL